MINMNLKVRIETWWGHIGPLIFKLGEHTDPHYGPFSEEFSADSESETMS